MSGNKMNMSLDEIIGPNKKTGNNKFSKKIKRSSDKRVPLRNEFNRKKNYIQNRFQKNKQNQSNIKTNNIRNIRSNYQRKDFQNKKFIGLANQNQNQNQFQKRQRLRVFGLDQSITNSDLFNIFSKVGPLKRCNIDYDNLGRSNGKAVIEYENFRDAKKAINEYNGGQLENKILRVEVEQQTSNQFMPRQTKRIQKRVYKIKKYTPNRL